MKLFISRKKLEKELKELDIKLSEIDNYLTEVKVDLFDINRKSVFETGFSNETCREALRQLAGAKGTLAFVRGHYSSAYGGAWND